MIQSSNTNIPSLVYELNLKATSDIYNTIFKPKERQGRYFIISKYDCNNSVDDVKMFDMDILEYYPIELSMQYLLNKYPNFKIHYFLLIKDYQYYLYDKDCAILEIQPVIKFN
ncbi:hypothetical protein RB653_009413 [Dictyostelium firmibasis]|uniref:Uncharacterized protein n=1 Tax=Dictyostelium firmibasis TaxID=79012 RepID=A0AAN7YXC9_9MYCE